MVRQYACGCSSKGNGACWRAYLSQRRGLQIPLVRVVLLLLDGTEKEIDLGDCNLGQGACAGGAAGTGTGSRARAEGRRTRVTSRWRRMRMRVVGVVVVVNVLLVEWTGRCVEGLWQM